VSTFSELFARLDPDPKVRGKQFEHVCKWFLTNEPTYKNTLRRVWLWNEWTGRGGGDAGIDLVAEDRDGRLRAASEYRGQPGRVHQQPTTTSMFTVMPGSPYVEP
jgi:predicted helicase